MTLFEKRLELLHLLGEVKVSKNGNYWVAINSLSQSIVKETNTRNVTKNTIGTNRIIEYSKDISVKVMLTSDNKLKFKGSMNTNFTTMSIKDVKNFPVLMPLYLYNKKCEFLKNYSHHYLNYFSLLRSFNSMNKVIAFLGVTAKIDITPDLLEKLILGFNIKNKSLVIDADFQLLQDTIKLAEILDIDICDTKKSILNLHDDLVEIQNMKEADNLSVISVVPSYYTFVKAVIKEAFPNVVFYTTEKDLFLAGKKFNNCIYTRKNNLSHCIFFSAEIKGIPGIFQCDRNSVIEGKGYYNRYIIEQVKIVNQILNTALIQEDLVLEAHLPW